MPTPQPHQTPADSVPEEEPVRLGDRLIDAGLITRGELDSTLELLRENGLSKRRLGRTLVDLGFLSDRELTKILGVHFGMPVATFSVSDADQAAIKEVPAEFARQHRLVPCQLSGESLSVAATGPVGPEVITELGRLTRHSVLVYLASEREIEAGLMKFYPEPGSEGAKTSGGNNGAPPLVTDPVKAAARSVPPRVDKPPAVDKRAPASAAPMTAPVKLQEAARAAASIAPPALERASELQDRVQRYAAQTRQFTTALQRIAEDNEQLSVDVGNLQREWETLREDNVRLQQEVDRARDDNMRLRKDLDRARKDKERVMAAVAKFSEEVLTWDQTASS